MAQTRLTSRQRKRLLAQERAAQRRQVAARRARAQNWRWVALGVVLLMVLSLTLALLPGASSLGRGSASPARPAEPGQKVTDLGNAHVTPANPIPQYNSDPPTSGPHFGDLPRPGIHKEPVDKRWQVHFLEDGGVIVQYKCKTPDECPELAQQLENIVKRYSEHVLLAPYPDLDRQIALTAWTRIDKFDTVDEDRIHNFIRAWCGIDHHAGASPARRTAC
jgi:hypothetical protein